MIAPGALVMVTPLPPKVMGLNVDEFVKPKVVVPAKVTTVPALTFERSMLLFEGA
jgi:hypothetical protein